MFIGQKEIKETKVSEEKTHGDKPIVEVIYADGSVEHFSQLMYDAIVTDKAIALSELRDKRVEPIVQVTLAMLREWGMKISELPYFSALLNNSLDVNSKEAQNLLWANWMPKPLDPDDVDFITIDRVLRSSKKTLKDII